MAREKRAEIARVACGGPIEQELVQRAVYALNFAWSDYFLVWMSESTLGTTVTVRVMLSLRDDSEFLTVHQTSMMIFRFEGAWAAARSEVRQ